MTIRGSDASRINVTINGIPLNDAESQGVWWVNMPDFTSSVSNIQIQRGVGTSTNGGSAFGASVNLNTNGLKSKKYVTLNNSVGSYNSLKNNIEEKFCLEIITYMYERAQGKMIPSSNLFQATDPFTTGTGPTNGEEKSVLCHRRCVCTQTCILP